MMDLDEWWKQFNGIVEYDSYRITTKISLCDEPKKLTNAQTILNEIELEKDLLLLWYSIFWIFGRINEKRFLPEKATYRSKIDTEVNNFIRKHKQDSSYYVKRYTLTENESDKLRYSFVSWFLLKDESYLKATIQIACNIITTMLESQCKESKNYIIPCDLLSYAYTLFSFYNPTDDNIRQLLEDNALGIIARAKENNFYRWFLEPSEIVSNLLIHTNHDLASNMMTTLREGAEILSRQEKASYDNKISNCNLERELLDRSTQFIKFLNISEEEKNNLRKQTHILIGKSYEREAQLRHSKGEHPLVLANQCYLPASEEYLKAGDNKKREENLILFNKNNHFNPEDCHEYSVPIPNSILTPFEGETEADVIKSISENDLVFPDEDDIMNQINRELSEHPLLLGVSHLKLSNVGPTSGVAIKEDDIKKHLVHERKILHIQSYENFICQSILKLEESKKITNEGLIEFMTKFQLLDKNTIELVKAGISHHFNQDYLASIHILVPQLENVIRIFVKNSNINVLKEEKKAIMNKQFRGLLEDPEVAKLIGIKFSNYLIVKYADIKGINFRNNVSHGLLDLADFNHANSCALIYAILKLLTTYKDPNEEQKLKS